MRTQRFFFYISDGKFTNLSLSNHRHRIINQNYHQSSSSIKTLAPSSKTFHNSGIQTAHRDTTMAPPEEQLREIANNAEQDVNTYQAKTGAARGRDIDEAGVDTRVEKHFEGAHVSYEPDQVTNASYDRRIPPEEGGDTDHRGR